MECTEYVNTGFALVQSIVTGILEGEHPYTPKERNVRVIETGFA